MTRLVLLLTMILAGCRPADLLNATVPQGDVEIVRDVRYAPGPLGVFDLYRPRNAMHALVVVFLYGGAWRTGTKSIYPFVALPLARAGIVVAVPNMRLFPEVAYPAFLDDPARATAWVYAHATEYGGDPRRLFLMGHSAGAYDAAMLALDTPYLAAAGLGRGAIAGLIGLAGPYDFLPITDADIVPVFAGHLDDPATQPVHHVASPLPPTFLAAGSADTRVRPRNTVSLAAALRAHGGMVTTRLYPRVGHIGLVTAFAPALQWRAPVLRDVVRFIRETPPTR